VSTRTLWTVYDTWERSTGERLADKTPHTLASIAQEIHTITPTLDRRAVVGDSTRSVTGELHDYNRDYLQQLIALYPNERLAGVARNVVNNSSVPRMRYDYDYYADVLHALPKASVTPEVDRSALATAYWGEGTGNFMMRSDWKTDATYGHFQCGRYDESHAHADQGSFMIFKNDWLAYDSLQRSLSGTEQFMSLHNLMRLTMPDGAEVEMRANTQPCRVMALADNARYTYVAADLTPVYSWRHGDYARHQNKHNDRVKKVQREFLFIRPSTFVVVDRVETTVPTKQSWLLNTPVAPVVNGGEITVNNNGNTLARADAGAVQCRNGGGHIDLLECRPLGQPRLVARRGQPDRHGQRVPACDGHQRRRAERHACRRRRPGGRPHPAGGWPHCHGALCHQRAGRHAGHARRQR
jgi:hypothetical protein